MIAFPVVCEDGKVIEVADESPELLNTRSHIAYWASSPVWAVECGNSGLKSRHDFPVSGKVKNGHRRPILECRFLHALRLAKNAIMCNYRNRWHLSRFFRPV